MSKGKVIFKNENHGSAASSSLLSFSDLNYLGMFKVPTSGSGGDGNTVFSSSYAIMEPRVVSGDIRFWITGQWSRVGPDGNGIYDPIYEISYPGVSTDISTAPRATLLRQWPDIIEGRNLVLDPVNGGGIFGIWPEDLGGSTIRMWWVYASHYKTGGISDPFLCCTDLNDSTGAVIASYGPWRSDKFSQLTRGNLFPLPDDWIASYAPGCKFGVGGPVWSQNGGGPRGATCYTIPTFDPTTRPANTVDDYATGAQLALGSAIHHDHANPQSRTGVIGQYKTCFWAGNTTAACTGPGGSPPCVTPTASSPCASMTVDCPDGCCYDDAAGDVLVDGDSTFNNAIGDGDIASDTVTGRCFITTPFKKGFICFGTWIDVVDGVDYSPDTVPHQTYGPVQGQLYDGTSTPGLGHCVHQQVMNQGGGTGPKAASTTGFAMIFDPDEMGNALLGNRDAHLEASSVIKLKTLAPGVNELSTVDFGAFHHAKYEPINGLLFVPEVLREHTGFDFLPVIHVFQVNQGA
jgi:hypothetical protein